MTPGLYTSAQVPMADYLADALCDAPSLSSGAAHRIIHRSPYHAWFEHPRLGAGRKENTDATDTGSLAHEMLLGGDGKICAIDPEKYRSKASKDDPLGSIPKGWTNNAIREARDTARENGLLPVLPWDIADARTMADNAREFLATTEIAGVLDDGQGECTVIHQEGDTWFRSRPDWINEKMRVVLHYKTTKASANPEPFIRGVMNSFGYDMALAFYRRCWESLGDAYRDWQHLILAQEQEPPYACSLIGLSPVSWAIAEEKVQRAVTIWQRCMKTGVWPAYSSAIHYAEPTAFQLAQAEEQMARDAQETEQ
jgi:hypothetical protein